MQNLDALVRTLSDRNTSLSDILAACPFDPNRNLGGHLDDNIFFSTLFVPTEHFEKVRDRLYTLLRSELRSHRIISFTGFSGTGKTTFLKYFQRSASEFYHAYLDFHALYRHAQPGDADYPTVRSIREANQQLKEFLDSPAFLTIPAETQEKLSKTQEELEFANDAGNPILSILKTYLARLGGDALLSVFHMVAAHANLLGPYFSRPFLRELRAVDKESLRTHSVDLINAAGVDDTFTLFFLHTFTYYKPDKPVIIYFDNMDVVDLDYLSTYFQKTFLHCLTNATRLGQEHELFSVPIDFINRYYFIFCLRDGNAGSLNGHIADSLDHIALPFEFRMPVADSAYDDILERRVGLWEQVHDRSQSRLVVGEPPAGMVLKALRELKNDSYFRLVLAPLFNGDLRRVTKMVFTVAEQLAASAATDITERLASMSGLTGLQQYGLRGSLLFAAVSYLRQKTATSYPFFDAPDLNDRGQCLVSRAILTVLLNESDSGTVRDATDSTFRHVSLSSVIEASSPLYKPHDTVRTLAEAFLFHATNWVNLVSFRNIAVGSREAFDKHVTLGSDRLKQVTVTLNPAGFVYLRFVLIHYEFLSAMAGNTRPLFSVNLEPSNRVELRVEFLFEEMVVRTLKLMKQRIADMASFYSTEVVGKLRWDANRYLQSSFAFKHAGTRGRRQQGQFHAFRLVTSHLDYLDAFRLTLLQRHSDQTTLIPRVNRAMISLIERCIASLDDYPEFRSDELLFEEFRKRVQKIRDTGYTDIEQRIASKAAVTQAAAD